MLRLRPRLAAAASLVDGSGKVVDVGTDHAYLPVWLIQNGKCRHVLASDVGVLPLGNAEKTLRRCGLETAVSLRISDGLKNIRPEEADEIVICGMGGTLIAQILNDAPWIRRPEMRLVLQPMTHGEDVRRYLCENGFSIRKELCVTEAPNRVYCCIGAIWTGERQPSSPGYYYFGTLLHAPGAAQIYVRKQLDRIVTRADALAQARRYPEEEAMLREAIAYYHEQGSGHDGK